MFVVSTTPPANVTSTQGVFHYLANSVQHSLYRNGAVLTRRDRDGSDAGTEGVIKEARELTVENARLLEGPEQPTITRHGFELLAQPQQHKLDFFDHQGIAEHYYRECAEIIKSATGADQVYAFDHNVRSAAGKKSQQRIRGGQQVQGPAHIVHGDYTLTSAPQRLRDLSQPPRENDTIKSILRGGVSLLQPAAVDRALSDRGRFAIINLWRSISAEPVAVNPLGLCDSQTVAPEDLVVFEIHYADRIGENYFAKFSPRHRWYYFPAMTRDEALLIKQWDSAGELALSAGERADDTASDPLAPCTFSYHSAFEDPATADDAPDRWSIEVRCIVLYHT